MYWYQNDHLGTPRELTSHEGDIAWEAVYQAWGNTVTVEWQEVPQELNSIEQAYLLQPHRFQGQIYKAKMMLKENETIVFEGKELLEALKEIEFILISLHKIGSYYALTLPDLYEVYANLKL
ncbi:RHS protein [Acinetobacter stercoris]|uniref:RHS protein n=1 Tax=Acinetobacter stercoris TaxID=2126983 RepID=A0A2U3N2W7_9GAMM|nr:RHS domain-containing protein [Acinetobacter stercoris]SPL72040.1 RHS protein [Acinetobacter stercoris]